MTNLIKYKKSFQSDSIKDFKNSLIEDLKIISSIFLETESYTDGEYFGLLITLPNSKTHLCILKKLNQKELLKLLSFYFKIYDEYKNAIDQEDAQISYEQLESVFSSIFSLFEDDFVLSSSDLSNFKKIRITPVKSIFNF